MDISEEEVLLNMLAHYLTEEGSTCKVAEGETFLSLQVDQDIMVEIDVHDQLVVSINNPVLSQFHFDPARPGSFERISACIQRRKQ